MTVIDSHSLIERLEGEIREALPGSTIVVHVEPCEKDCESCKLSEREQVFRSKNPP
jgi:divalent metal cation (Fe/Co/Zn/Cd) transporter